ncbi:MAG: anti-sigma factor antagonist [Streptosporangiaceae bacterium]|jgi:hypothetical protein|nr:anti-sigma factor antagonist [Streptosporangiaceae bacterium]
MNVPARWADTGETSFVEAIDWPTATIRARGRLTEPAVDLLRGSAEALRRSGHATVTLDLRAVRSADGRARDALGAFVTGVRAQHRELVVLFGPSGHHDLPDEGECP